MRELAGARPRGVARAGRVGALRLVWRSPGWDDVLDLAFDEIRGYGASSLQVARRLRAVLEDLLAATPSRAARRHSASICARLDAAVLTAYPAGSPERELAQVPDRTGLGLARR